MCISGRQAEYLDLDTAVSLPLATGVDCRVASVNDIMHLICLFCALFSLAIRNNSIQ